MGIDGIQETGPNISVHIEQIVLEGVDIAPHQVGELQGALERELTRLLNQRQIDGALSIGCAVQQRQGDPIMWSAEEGITRLGTQIAQAVYGGMVA